jgi:hypothetical protein
MVSISGFGGTELKPVVSASQSNRLFLQVHAARILSSLANERIIVLAAGTSRSPGWIMINFLDSSAK